jgi:hypothetical protein
MPLPALMSSQNNTWYYMVSANFYTNHVGEVTVSSGKSAKKKDADAYEKQLDEAMKGVRGRQGAKGAKTSVSTMIFAPAEALKIALIKELSTRKKQYEDAGRDNEGRVKVEFTTADSYTLLTAELNGEVQVVSSRFEYGVCFYPDKKFRITHFAGIHV